MQNYLHSRKRRKVKRAIMLLAATLFAALVIEKHIEFASLTTAENPDAYKYLTVKDSAKMNTLWQGKSENDETESKMNNFLLENAKSEQTPMENDIVEQTVEEISVLKEDGSVENMKLEDYVLGCLLGEMPLSFHPQALMAQCVAIRSFTVNKITEGSKHKNALVCTSPACCQNYVSPSMCGYSEEYIVVARQAVNATKNVVATWENAPINAVYHAASSERTKDSTEVWGGVVEYLKSVKSPDGEAVVCSTNYSGNTGHGVGMSQQGANILAKDGYSYTEILKYYYTGIEFDLINTCKTAM